MLGLEVPHLIQSLKFDRGLVWFLELLFQYLDVFSMSTYTEVPNKPQTKPLIKFVLYHNQVTNGFSLVPRYLSQSKEVTN